jgi:ABC-type oligopeptide transport system ATPase subunit
MHSPLIDVQSLSKQYGRLKVFDDVSFSVNEGKTLGLFGISGSGKTTISRCMMLLERPSIWRGILIS